MSKKIIRIIIAVIIVVLIAIGAISLLKKRKAQLANLPTPERPVYVVKGTKVKKGEITIKRIFIGRVYSDNTVKIATKFGGYIKDIKINEGDLVRKGQIIATIDPTPVKLEIENLKHNIDILKSQLNALLVQKESAKTALKTAENIYRRNKKLYEKKAISKEKLEISETNYKKAKAAYNAVLSNIQVVQNKIKETRNKIKIRQNDLNYLYVKSPVDGVVTKVLLREGNFAGKGKPIAVIEKEGNYKILVSLPEQVKKGTSVILKTENSEISAKVSKIYPETDRNSLYIAEIRIDKLPGGVKIGSLVNLDFILSKKEGLLVPKNAILHLTNGTYILTLKNNKFTKIPVKVIASDEKNALIQGNISEGTPVAIAEENKLRLLALGKKGKLIINKR